VSLKPGQMLAHYRLEEQIGAGGMGVVYVAEDTRLGRRIALKVLPAAMAGDPARRARFEREARAIAALNHPNIVTLHSVEESDGVTFLTMELIDGRRLGEVIPREGLALPKIVEYSLAIADALVAAHEQGVIHRDLKPDNIMVTGSGRLKVLDFGLAKMREPAPAAPDTALPTASVTEEGKILGTVAYMSPEQAEGKALDHRSDIFSFGVVLYEMATGRRPFQGDTAISTLSAILRDTPVPPNQINTSLPLHLARIVRRCLEKEPERRYQSTKDLRNDLREVKEDSESGARSAETVAAAVASRAAGGVRSSRRPLSLGTVVLAALAAIGLAAWLWGRAGSAKAPPAAMETSIQMSRVTTDGKVSEVAISPDGRYVAYVRSDGPLASLRLKQLASGTEAEVVPPGEATLRSPSFTPDGDYLQYVLVEAGKISGQAYRVSVLGGTPRAILGGVVNLRASPDGRRLAATDLSPEQSRLELAGFDGENPRVLTTRKGTDHFDSEPAWSPDGRSIAIVSHRYGEAQQIVRIDADTEKEEPVPLPTLRSFSDVCWIPGGHGLLVAGSDRPANQSGAPPQIWEASLDGSLRPLTRDLNSYTGIDVTADGATLAAVQLEVRSGIDVAPVHDGTPGSFETIYPVSPARAGSDGLAWLGTDRLVHSMLQTDVQQIYVTDLTTRSPRALTTGGSHQSPSVSRDGRTLVVVGSEGTHSNLWRVDPDSGRTERLTTGQFSGFPVLASDGSWVVYTSIQESLDLRRMPASGGSAAIITDRPCLCVDVAADDSEALCWTWNAAGERSVVRVPPGGGEPRPVQGLPADVSGMRFGPDGRSVTYVVPREGADELWSLPAGGGQPRRLARFELAQITNFAWSPDGRRLAVVKLVRSGDVVLLRRGSSG
jgi:Tol biopolymer transport system component/predicted Ser/Thr protein kinase